METKLPADFKEFLKLLKQHGVEYLLIGGYAVAFYGYSRPTADMDIWIAVAPPNAERMVAAIRAFGYDTPDLNAELFLKERTIIRMGVPPLRLEILTTISGVEFAESYAERETAVLDGVEVDLIGLRQLKRNKQASGRPKDLADLEYL
jgi:predicted nucleotidyltransferase